MRVAATLLALAGLVIVGIGLTVIGARMGAGDVTRAVASLFHCVLVAPLVVGRTPAAPARWLALFFAVAGFGGVVVVTPYLPIPPLYRRLLGESTFAAAALAAGILWRFAQVSSHPASRDRPERWRGQVERFAVAGGAVVGAVYVVFVLVGQFGPRAAQLAGEAIVITWFVFAVFHTLMCMLRGYRGADHLGQVRIRWNLLAVALWLLAGLTGLSLFWLGIIGTLRASWTVQVIAFSTLFVAGSTVMAIGVLLKGSVDPDLALRRSVIAGGVLAMAVFTFGVLEAAVSDLLLSRVELPAGASLWIAAGTVALMVHPVSEWLRPRVNGWFDRLELGRSDR